MITFTMTLQKMDHVTMSLSFLRKPLSWFFVNWDSTSTEKIQKLSTPCLDHWSLERNFLAFQQPKTSQKKIAGTNHPHPKCSVHRGAPFIIFISMTTSPLGCKNHTSRIQFRHPTLRLDGRKVPLLVDSMRVNFWEPLRKMLMMLMMIYP